MLMAVVTGLVHLLIATQAIQFDRTMAALFVLNGAGFLALTALYLSRYWRRHLYLVFAAYAVVTILALFAFQGWGPEAFYRGDSLNPMAVVSKVAEAVLAAATIYLYAEDSG